MDIDESWQTWIAENLIRDQNPSGLVDILVRHGCAPELAATEVERARRHPYVKAGSQLGTVLRKHDWMLNNLCQLERLSARHGQVDRKYRLSGDEFFENYYCTNTPVVIQGAMDDWPALGKWSPAYFREHYGEAKVQVQSQRSSDPLFEINASQHRKQVRFADFIDAVEQAGETNDYYMTANNGSVNHEVFAPLWADIVQLPDYLDRHAASGRFLWFGPAGTITPLHHDLTNNFMAQVHGRKRVRIASAHHVAQLYNSRHCYSEFDPENPDFDRFPLSRSVPFADVVLNPGEVLFLPVGSWHHVRGLDITITVSFTCFQRDNDFSSSYSTYGPI